MAEFLIDTNVLSRVFTGDGHVKQFVDSLDAAVCTVVYVECLQGSKSNREKRIVESYLARFDAYHLTSAISARTIDLIRNYSNTHGLLLADALIAATCLVRNVTLVTYNANDFRFISDLKHLVPPV
ncbi:MAG TPA: PIN domain-containing protein [Pyrinomonadaceae bacterium]|jgi:predicted nucleic acid-binding protein